MKTFTKEFNNCEDSVKVIEATTRNEATEVFGRGVAESWEVDIHASVPPFGKGFDYKVTLKEY